MIPKDKVYEIVASGNGMEISTIAAAIIESGYKHPERQQTEGERVNAFTTDLEQCLKSMCEEGKIKSEMIGGKIMYTNP